VQLVGFTIGIYRVIKNDCRGFLTTCRTQYTWGSSM